MTRLIREAVPEDMPLEMILNKSLEKLEILGDPILPRVFHNLIENVVRHGENATSLKVSGERKDGGIEILFRDNGKGVADWIRYRYSTEGSERTAAWDFSYQRRFYPLPA